MLEGEDEETALRRELVEELGLVDFELGRFVLERTHSLPWSGRILRQHERYYLVRVEAFAVVPMIDLAPEHVTGHRWWTLDELESTGERIAPPRLAELVRSL